MNESILKALMQLFAIIANVNKEGVSITARNIVETYLKQQLNKEQLDEYMNLFDEYLAFHHRDFKKQDSNKGRKRTSVNSVKVLMICEQINEELQREQKILVLLQLIEFISYGDEITEKELDFAKTVANTFNISEMEYSNCKSFLLDTTDDIPEKDKVLIIDNNASYDHPEIKHIYSEYLNGEIVVLNISSVNMYVFRYFGKDNLYLNSQIITPKWGYVFVNGSSIRGPKINPVYYSDVAGRFLQALSKSKIVFTAKDIEFRFKNSENGIHKFNFSEESGQLIGIMGGSGVGKSTLLNVLNGNLKPKSGEITINSYDIFKNRNILEGVIGFIPQDDLLMEELTVFQNLYYNAKLCFKNFSEEEINKAVEKILIDLDLHEIKNLRVGDPLNKFISGGQRKRLNIALELIREPSVLFVDEPTSGLSSVDSEMVMDLLKEQTLKGKLLIVNIHQPSSDLYKLFDKLIILDKGGYPIYYGNPIDAVVYFKKMTHHVNAEESDCIKCGNVNPEQVLQIIEAKVVDEYGKLTLNRKISPKEWYDLYLKNIETEAPEKESKEELPVNYFNIPNKFKQFKIFCIRNILSKLTDKQYLLITFLEAPLLAVILGYFTKYISGIIGDPDAYIFSNNENLVAYLFMSVVVSLFLGLTISAEEIIKDRKILQRESFLHLSRFSYLNSKIVILFVISAIQAISFVLVGNLILGIKGMTLSYWLVLFTASCFANILGLNISAALNSVVTIYILIPFILVPQMLLSGVIVNFDKLHKSFSTPDYVPFIGDLMTSRWAYEALAVHQFKNNKFQKIFFFIKKEMSDATYKQTYLIPALQTKLDVCEMNIINGENKQETIRNLKILTNEIKQLQAGLNLPVNNPINTQLSFIDDSLTINSFNRSIANKTRDYLNNLRKIFIKDLRNANYKFEKKYSELIETLAGKEHVNQLKRDYHNNSLADLVLNKKELNKIVETDDRFIQKMEPIYKYPESNFGRAHFYAPVKKIFGKHIDTLWFNIIAIWFTIMILYITLCHNSLKKLITSIENIKFIRPGRK